MQVSIAQQPVLPAHGPLDIQCAVSLGELNVRDIAANIVNVIAKAIMSVLGMLRVTRH